MNRQEILEFINKIIEEEHGNPVTEDSLLTDSEINKFKEKYFPFIKIQANKPQPIIMNNPPSGVIGPKNLRFTFQCSANDNKQILTEKTNVPAIKDQAAERSNPLLN